MISSGPTSSSSGVSSLINSLDALNSLDSTGAANSSNALDSEYSINTPDTLNLLNPIGSLDKSSQTYGSNTDNGSNMSFSDMLQSMMNDTTQTNAQTNYDAINLAMGLTSDADLQNIQINAIKADLALRTMIAVRNKALDAYTEIMRMNV